MIHGTLAEQPGHAHVRLRHALLDAGNPLAEPPFPVLRPPTGSIPALAGELLGALAADGLALAQLAEPLDDEDFVTLGRRLGTLMPETDPAVQPFVEHGVVLNLRSEHAHTDDAALRPFARNSLTLHSEGSARPAGRQPRYIMLMCCDPGEDGTRAQTVVVPMAPVARRLEGSACDRLARTRYRDHPEAPYLMRRVENRSVFSFRDPSPEPMHWLTDAEDGDGAATGQALLDLLAAMYGGPAYGVHWRRGALVVIDNTFHFHGRTGGTTAAATRDRHLKRLRII